MFYVGIDIGSTSAKVAVLDEDKRIIEHSVCPTGWNSVETADKIRLSLRDKGMEEGDMRVVATGYGRVSVRYAHKAVTEITCHGKGAVHLFANQNCAVLDIGGQDTKVILLEKGKVKDFVMNDKCSAGTGRFLEIMAATLGVPLVELFALAESGSGITITSMCTVFAESEVISLIGQGTPKEDIAYGVVDSIISRVHSQCGKLVANSQNIYLTGGLCEVDYILDRLAQRLEKTVVSNGLGRYAGAVGAALCAMDL